MNKKRRLSLGQDMLDVKNKGRSNNFSWRGGGLFPVQGEYAETYVHNVFDGVVGVAGG